jgi:hypothetical protein
MDKELNRKMMDWITSNGVGLSSQTLWAVIMGLEMPTPSIPHDVYDFARCYNLLKLCDEETRRKTIHDAAEQYQVWKPLDLNWNKLTELYEDGNAQELNGLLGS